MWDERYSQRNYVYGTEPNDFLAAVAHQIPPGPVLSLGEGEGRNAVFLAGLGHRVVAVDQSDVGLAKARQLAADRGLTIETVCADLECFTIKPTAWAGIVSIFCHLPKRLRLPLHQAVVKGLQPGGILVLENYTAQQIGRGTGGPQEADMMPSLAELTAELSGLTLVHACEMERDVCEGIYHTGIASVAQVVGLRRET
jgi:SAM-dependent methyltransferase